MVKLIIVKFSNLYHLIFFLNFLVLNFDNLLIFQIKQLRIFDHFLN